MVDKAAAGHKRQKNRRGVRFKATASHYLNTLMLSFYLCNTALCDTLTMELS